MAGRRQGARLERLARRLCPARSDGQRSHVLVPRAAEKLSADDARAHIVGPVAAVVARTCEWGGLPEEWEVGDYRFLVLDFCPRKDVGLYVQIWTEPGEPVLIEACSGAWNPTARPYVQAPQRAALRKLGYRVAGQARNYQKYWTLSPLADARALAGELASILVDVFGYRGRHPLEMAFCSDSRTTTARVFPALAIDDVKRMLGMAGCRVVDAEPAGRVKPDVRRRLIHVDEPFPMVVEMRGQAGKTPATYEAMRLVTPLPAGRGLPQDALELLVRECPFGRTFRDDDGDLLFIADLVVVGTTVRWFLTALRVWMHMRQRVVEMLRLVLAPPSSRAGSRTGGAGGDGGEDGPEPDEAAGEDDAGDEESGGLGKSRQARVTVH